MVNFLLILFAAFVAVDLIVRFVIDPLLKASREKSKVSKSYSTKFDPSVRLATETMFDGGKPHNEENIKSDSKEKENTEKK